jgi:UDP-N-acetylglucosamine 2-epimerase
MRVVTIVGTRPEIIKLSLVIKELDKSFNHILIHTGQNFDYELNQIFFDELQIRKPDYFLNANGDSPVDTVANVLKFSYDILKKITPDAILIYGDTNSCLSGYSAKRLKIPVFHMEAGNRCFDERVPEEINRRIIDHLSDINLVISEHARSYLVREGFRPDRIIKIGSCMYEVLNHFADDINSQINDFPGKSYIIVSLHREENIDSQLNMDKAINLLIELNKKFNKKIIVSCHPRLKKRLLEFNINMDDINGDEILFMKPYGFLKYIKLQREAYAVISDSGTISEESNILKFPAVTIRYAHERPEAMDKASVVMVGFNIDHVIKAIELVVRHKSIVDVENVDDYHSQFPSILVPRIILSYVNFINQNTWKIKD